MNSLNSIINTAGAHKYRKRFTSEQRLMITQESMLPENSVSATARKYGIHPTLLYKWRNLMKNGQTEAIKSGEHVVPLSEAKALQKRVYELERMLGKKTLEVEILKEAVRIGREKKLISPEPLQGLGDFK